MPAAPAAPLDVIGVGIDTARHGHRAAFLRPDRRPAAPPLTVLENRAGYQALRDHLERLHQQHPQARFHVRIDAAGQYAANLEHFLRGLPLPLVISIGEPKRNKDYQKAHFPKRTTDDTESQAMARFAVVEQPPATPAVPPPMALLREVASRLHAGVKQTTRAVNRLHNLMARVFPELADLARDFSAGWVLDLLDRYPTPQRLARARVASLADIPYLPQDLAEPLRQAAASSIGSQHGEVAETLVRDLVSQVRHGLRHEEQMRRLLTEAFEALPPSGHRQLLTIPGIGPATAAVLVAKVVAIERFASPEHLVGYFGIFPQEDSSGVTPDGQPRPAGSQPMSHKGNDLVRAYLWNAARSAIQHNPAVRALYRRLTAGGKRGDVALGHCMRKLLHLVHAVWTTDRPFDPEHFPWEGPPETPSALDQPSAPAPAASAPAAAAPAAPATPAAPAVSAAPVTPAALDRDADPDRVAAPAAPSASALPAPTVPAAVAVAANEEAVGHMREVPAGSVVTTASAKGAPPPPPVNRPSARAARPRVDYTFLREQVGMEQVLRHLGVFAQLRGRGQQRRGPCPVHRPAAGCLPTFSVHLGKNVWQCFQTGCEAHGNVLDLWSAVHRLPLYEAALHLAETFGLRRNREEEPVNSGRPRGEPASKNGPVITADDP